MKRVASAGHLAFAAIMIALGIQGFIQRDFTAVWQPVPKGAPAREVLVYFCAAISLACGIGLLFRRTAPPAARVLFAALVIWFLLWRVRFLFAASLIEGTWSAADTMAIAAAAWLLFARGENVRIARALYGLAMIPFGYAHFANVKGTASLVPAWLPWHTGWAYFTGATFIAAGLAIVSGVQARLAAALSALQMGAFALLVWLPIVGAGHVKPYQWLEFATTIVLATAGWVVADSYENNRESSLAPAGAIATAD